MNCASLSDTVLMASFDLFRLTKSKAAVDISANTLRGYHKKGLPFYRRGRAVFVSRTDLAVFLRSGPASVKSSAYDDFVRHPLESRQVATPTPLVSGSAGSDSNAE